MVGAGSRLKSVGHHLSDDFFCCNRISFLRRHEQLTADVTTLHQTGTWIKIQNQTCDKQHVVEKSHRCRHNQRRLCWEAVEEEPEWTSQLPSYAPVLAEFLFLHLQMQVEKGGSDPKGERFSLRCISCEKKDALSRGSSSVCSPVSKKTGRLKVADVLVTFGRLSRGKRNDLTRKPSIPRGRGIRKPLYRARRRHNKHSSTTGSHTMHLEYMNGARTDK